MSYPALDSHKWTGVQRGGDPADAGSAEYVRYCSVCGMEDSCEDPLPPCPGPSIEQQIAELERCHWTRKTATVWKSPSGKLFQGPHGAWKAMRSSEVFRRILGEALAPADLKPCPFCGNAEPILDALTDEDEYFVHCPSCNVQQIANHIREHAISEWNRRGCACL